MLPGTYEARISLQAISPAPRLPSDNRGSPASADIPLSQELPLQEALGTGVS